MCIVNREQQNGGNMINRRMKALRILRGLTQDAVASELQIDRSKISRIEHGYVNPKSEEKKKIARILQTQPEQLFPEN